MSMNLNIALVALAALMALIPSNSIAHNELTEGVCVINGVDTESPPPHVIEGTGGADTIDCHHSNNINGHFIAGGGGNDIIIGSKYNDKIDGGGNDDDIYGGPGNDIIFGGVGASPASGVSCELQMAAAGRIFLAKGGSGDDDIYGGEGDDCINAGSGEDVVDGGPGNDTIYGGNHADLIVGGPGIDYIDGGWHTDTCVDDIDDVIICENLVGGLDDPDDEDPGGGGPNCDSKPPDHPKCS